MWLLENNKSKHMKKSYQDIEYKRKDGSVWFNDLQRKRESGPKFQDKRYTNFGAATKSVHAGQYDDPKTGALGTPIFQCSTFYLNEASYEAIEEGRGRDEMIYTRYGNPSQWSVQEKISSLEKAESSIVFSSEILNLFYLFWFSILFFFVKSFNIFRKKSVLPIL